MVTKFAMAFTNYEQMDVVFQPVEELHPQVFDTHTSPDTRQALQECLSEVWFHLMLAPALFCFA